MRTKLVLMLPLFLLSLSSCSSLFEENEVEQGYVAGKIVGDVAPSTTEGINVRYYNYYSGLTDQIGEPDVFSAQNTFLTRLQTGEYKFLAYSLLNNKVRKTEDITTIEIYADTVYSSKYDTYVIKNKQSLVYSGSDRGAILREDTTNCLFSLRPMVLKVVCNVTVKGMSALDVDNVETLLSGVITGRKIYTNQPISDTASQIMSYTSVEGEANKFTSSVYVFGISQVQNNYMDVACSGSYFSNTSRVDLTSILSKATNDGIEINIEVNIGEDMNISNITITDWKDLEQGSIVF
ncbi:MAG: hypothetical protein H6Q13_3044 [Bacteroidetes bacterium]|nr:hypothetical protein [Bacteroidota bacterium]